MWKRTTEVSEDADLKKVLERLAQKHEKHEMTAAAPQAADPDKGYCQNPFQALNYEDGKPSVHRGAHIKQDGCVNWSSPEQAADFLTFWNNWVKSHGWGYSLIGGRIVECVEAWASSLRDTNTSCWHETGFKDGMYAGTYEDWAGRAMRAEAKVSELESVIKRTMGLTR